jgi:F0F1-type ATP synthase membrane subunit c/vacuolar-type H+-ATPase subunit K
MSKKFVYIVLSSIFAFCVLAINSISTTKAQELSSGLAIQIPVEGEAFAGDIVCAAGTLFAKCKTEYNTAMYGVVVEQSSLQITDTEIENGKLVVTGGIATVRVTNANGEIKKGNLLTSSNTEGLAQLASKNGYVLGTALEDFVGDTGTVQAVINIHPAAGMGKSSGSNLVQFIREGLTVPVFEPLESFRYLLAGLMVVIAFTLGLLYFGKSSRAGIEAIGRNPLAKSTIQFTTVLNVLLTIVIVAAGLGVAYFILIL